MDAERTPIQRAVAIMGNRPSALAAAIGGKVKRQNVEYWLASNRVPAEYCPSVQRVTGGAVTCKELRPDVEWEVLSGDIQPGSPVTSEAA